MTWQEFATKLFYYEEADPLYYALARSNLDRATQMRYIVAMFCTFYHHGIAGEAAQYQGTRFWDYLDNVYPTATRASERRHFRGKAGLLALQKMRLMFPHPEALVESTWAPTYFGVRTKCKTLPLVGDYFTWKFADVQDRVFGMQCDFTGAEQFSSTVPVEGAKLIAPTLTVAQVYSMIVDHMRPQMAPPWYDRPILLQEAETVCCFWHKYKSKKGWSFGMATMKALREYATHDNPINRELAAAQTLGLPYVEQYE